MSSDLKNDLDKEKEKEVDVEKRLLNIEISQPEVIPYPRRVFLILVTEFCERFNWSGMRSNFFTERLSV